MASKTQSELLSAVLSAFEDGVHTDVIIKCQGHEFRAHKMLLCTRSPFFSRALVEGRWKEGLENTIELGALTAAHLSEDKTDLILTSEHDDDNSPEPIETPKTVELLLRFIYTGDYQTTPNEITGQVNNPFKTHVLMYAIGDKYEIPMLKDIALAKFRKIINEAVEPAPFCEAIDTVYAHIREADKSLEGILILAINHRRAQKALKEEVRDFVSVYNTLVHGLWLNWEGET